MRSRVGRHRAWPGDVGVIVRSNGNGWWCYRVEFATCEYCLTRDRLENLIRVPDKKAKNPPDDLPSVDRDA